ncbi:MAG: membrane protein insertase YidC [Bacteroidetes bacterium HGW-Bacteroidetes-17]|jgi:YidC/Oxa1 family membrane protein insertase|nr:MAG: membrane protein insertase YidC [Bacteroidetes bacterium HGW-Bacteroidetes-17]
MNKNNIIGVLLLGAIFITWSILLKPSKEEIQEKQRVQDSISAVNQANYLRQDSINKSKITLADESNIVEAQNENSSGSQEILASVDKSKYSVFANSAVGEEKITTIENELFKLQFSNKGARILSAELTRYKTYDSLPLILFDSEANKFGISFFINNYRLNTQDFYFQPFWPDRDHSGEDDVKIKGDESVSFGMRLYTDNGEDSYNPNQYIEFLYTISGNKYMFDYKINIVGLKDVLATNANYLNLEWETNILKQERSIDRWNGPTVFYKYASDEVDYLSETKDDSEVLKSKVKWISFKQRFFSTALIANDAFVNAEISGFTDPDFANDPRYLKSMKSTIGIPYSFSGDQSIQMSFYFGPNKYNILRKYHLGLERQIPLGWSFAPLAWINIYAVIPVFNFLGGFGWNYGIIILVLTILLKLVLFPIAYKTYKSTAKMRVLKPEIDEIGLKFPKKEDAMKKQQATMALYKKAGVNPMAGCVPMLLQMPILFAMFRFFPSSIELRQQSFLWATDLSSYDSIFSWTAQIPILSSVYGNHISLFTLLMTISTIIYTKMNNDMMASGSQQMPGMKTMMYLMPIMFLGMFNGYASGLSYYYFLANIITFGQMYLIRATIDEKKILKQIELNKKKPVKKSNFQKRLEEAAKKRGYSAPKK